MNWQITLAQGRGAAGLTHWENNVDGETSGCSTGCLGDDEVDGEKRNQVNDSVNVETSGLVPRKSTTRVLQR